MDKIRVKTLLFLSSSKTRCSFSLLFHFARYWAQQGRRVFFVSQNLLNQIPLVVGKYEVMPFDSHMMKMIQIMYLKTWQELLQQLYTINLRHHLISVIIIHNLDYYFKHDLPNVDHDQASLICGSLLFAASVCGRLTAKDTILISEYVNEDLSIEMTVIKNFFHNIWRIQICEETLAKKMFRISKLSQTLNNEVVSYTFNENIGKTVIEFEEVVKKIIDIIE